MLEDKIKAFKSYAEKNKWFMFALGAYLTTSFADAYLTRVGLEAGIIKEWNPIAQYFIENLGITEGIFVFKSTAIPILFLTKYAENHLPKYKAHLPLYVGTVGQTAAIIAWTNVL